MNQSPLTVKQVNLWELYFANWKLLLFLQALNFEKLAATVNVKFTVLWQFNL